MMRDAMLHPRRLPASSVRQRGLPHAAAAAAAVGPPEVRGPCVHQTHARQPQAPPEGRSHGGESSSSSRRRHPRQQQQHQHQQQQPRPQAAAAGGRVPWSSTHAAVLAAIRSRELPLQGARLLVAVSGGQDSMCLLQLLLDLRHLLRAELVVAHCNHATRADAADNAAFVAAEARRRGLACLAATATTEDLRKEEAAREWRYQQLYRAAVQAGCSAVVTGHTATDRAETMLFNMSRGCGADGLSSLPWQRPLGPGVTLVRPLLDLTRDVTGEACRSSGVQVYEDSTNQDTRYTRNYVRLEVVPLLQRVNRRAAQHMAQLADLLDDDVAFLEASARRLLNTMVTASWGPEAAGLTAEELAGSTLSQLQQRRAQLLAGGACACRAGGPAVGAASVAAPPASVAAPPASVAAPPASVAAPPASLHIVHRGTWQVEGSSGWDGGLQACARALRQQPSCSRSCSSGSGSGSAGGLDPEQAGGGVGWVACAAPAVQHQHQQHQQQHQHQHQQHQHQQHQHQQQHQQQQQLGASYLRLPTSALAAAAPALQRRVVRLWLADALAGWRAGGQATAQVLRLLRPDVPGGTATSPLLDGVVVRKRRNALVLEAGPARVHGAAR